MELIQVFTLQNGNVSITSNNNYNLPPMDVPSCLSELIYAIYSNGGASRTRSGNRSELTGLLDGR